MTRKWEQDAGHRAGAAGRRPRRTLSEELGWFSGFPAIALICGIIALGVVSVLDVIPPHSERRCDLSRFSIATDGSLSVRQQCVLHDDLERLERIELNAQGEWLRRLFGTSAGDAAAGAELRDWLTARITRVGHRRVHEAIAANLGHAARTGALAEEHPYGAVVFTSQYFRADRMSRLGVLVHEARHSDGDRNISLGVVDADHPDTSHVRCRMLAIAPASPGELTDSGCDEGITGAHGYEWIFLTNIWRSCSSCSDEERAQARDAALRARGYLLQLPDLDLR